MVSQDSDYRRSLLETLAMIRDVQSPSTSTSKHYVTQHLQFSHNGDHLAVARDLEGVHVHGLGAKTGIDRSEERRVGKECRN